MMFCWQTNRVDFIMFCLSCKESSLTMSSTWSPSCEWCSTTTTPSKIVICVKTTQQNATRLHQIYSGAACQCVLGEGDGWLTVCALCVDNTHSFLKAMTSGTAAAVRPARTHTGETAGITPEEETQRLNTCTNAHETERATRSTYRPTTTNTSAKTSRNRLKPSIRIKPAISQ